MQGLRRRVENGDAPPILFVTTADREATERFFANRWPDVAAVSDPEKHLYRILGLERGRLGQLMKPAVWRSGLRALLRGAGLGAPRGDIRAMSAFFLVRRDGTLLWHHVSDHAGDVDVLEDIPTSGSSAEVGS